MHEKYKAEYNCYLGINYEIGLRIGIDYIQFVFHESPSGPFPLIHRKKKSPLLAAKRNCELEKKDYISNDIQRICIII